MTVQGPILVVDDDEDIRDVIGMALRVRGYRVETAADGAEAMQLLENGMRPSLILLDVMMPNMDGAAVLAAVRNSVELRDIPIVLLSGDTKIAERASQLHSNGYMVKPIDVGRLATAVEHFARSA